MGTLGLKMPRPWKHGRSAWMMKKCDCPICHEAMLKYGRDRSNKYNKTDRKTHFWTEEDVVLLSTAMTSHEIAEKIGVRLAAVEKKRSRLGLGLRQRAIRLPKDPAEKRTRRVLIPLPDPLARGQRIRRIKGGKVYRIAAVKPDFVYIVGVDSMRDQLLDVDYVKLADNFEGVPTLFS